MHKRWIATMTVLLAASAFWSCYLEPVGVVQRPRGYVYQPEPWVVGPPVEVWTPPPDVWVWEGPGYRMDERHGAVRGEVWQR